MIGADRDVAVRDSLLRVIKDARAQTDHLFQLVSPDSLYERPIAERHRIVFYIGHLEAFDWNLLQPRLPHTKVFDASFDRLFAFGIDPVGRGLPTDRPEDWPALSEVERYRDRVRSSLDDALATTAFENWAGDEHPRVLLNVALEHRLMHAETLAYMLHQLPMERKRKASQIPIDAHEQPQSKWIDIPAGQVTLGLSSSDPTNFGWDNEYEAHTVSVPGFAIERYKITNRQYLEFCNAGGYEDRSLWTPEGWAWKTEQDVRHPVFWKRANGSWHYYTMFDEIPLPLDWPVYTSHAEASAYAAWAGTRLPTEAEWQRASCGVPAPDPQTGFFDFERWDPFPVNSFPDGCSAFGVEDLYGNGWEWTSSLFAPFPGFRRFPFYKGYSADFFDGKHYLMKGASTRTARSMLRPTFRNWFQPHYQYVYTGFRCAKD